MTLRNLCLSGLHITLCKILQAPFSCESAFEASNLASLCFELFSMEAERHISSYEEEGKPSLLLVLHWSIGCKLGLG